MTPKQRLLALVDGKPSGPVLFHPILMHFAARFAGETYSRFATDYRVLVESNVRCMERFGHHAVSTISDPFRETAAFGASIEFPVDGVPKCVGPIVRTEDDIGSLRTPNVLTSPRTADRIRATEYYRELLGDSVPVIGWIEGPLAEACDLAGVTETLLGLAMRADWPDRLMARCLPTAIDFARAQIGAGADVMGIGDAICSQVSEPMYRRHVLPLHQELFDRIHAFGALVKLHICGDITHLLPALAEAGVDILDLDWMVSTDMARDAVGLDVALCGNLDPVAVVQDLPAAEVHRRAANLIEKTSSERFILSAGCEVTVNTPAGNLSALAQAAIERTYSP